MKRITAPGRQRRQTDRVQARTKREGQREEARAEERERRWRAHSSRLPRYRFGDEARHLAKPRGVGLGDTAVVVGLVVVVALWTQLISVILEVRQESQK